MPDNSTPIKHFSESLRRIVQSSQISRSVRACLLATRDREHALNAVKEAAFGSATPLHLFTVAERRRFHREQLRWENVGGETPDPANLLRNAAELRGGGVVVLEDCAAFLRDEGGDRRMRMALAQMLSSDAATEGLVLVFLEPPEAERYLPSILADQFVHLDIPYPRADELETIAIGEVDLVARRAGRPLEVETVRSESKKLAPGLVGLTRSAARDALRDALAPNPVDFCQAMERLQTRKADQLRRELSMNVLDTSEVEMPIGLDNLVQFLQIHRDKMQQFGPGRARGVLVMGPPGTGKTMLARAIGHVTHLPVVEFRLSSLMNSLLAARGKNECF